MSLAGGHRVLELSSQAALLERLGLLTNFGSNFIHVSGEAGSGKTWLAQRYLEVWAADKNQSLLLCFRNQSDAQRRQTILSQLRREVEFDENADLVDSFCEIMEGDNCNIVIVVDDAQQLSEIMLTELWSLVQTAQLRSNWSISVVLFSRPNLLDRLLNRISHGQEQKPVDLEIDVLPQEDADRFFEFSVMRFVDDDMERRVRFAYSKARKTPGEIMALGEQKMEKRIIIRSIVGSPINIAIVVVLLALAIGGGYWWLLNRTVMPNSDHKGQQVTDIEASDRIRSTEQTIIPTLTEIDSKDDSNSLPPVIAENTSNVGFDETTENQRVVITSDVVDALLDGSSENSQILDEVVIDSELTTGKPDEDVINVDSAEVSELIASGEATAEQVEQLKQAVTSIPESTLGDENSIISVAEEISEQDENAQAITNIVPVDAEALAAANYHESQLLSLSESSYTLQLAAFNRQRDVGRFINESQLGDKLYAYTTIRNGVTWYIMVYDNFSTLQLTRDAIETLPDSIKALNPWAKSISQVHRDIEAGK
ncbi:AAA family ATPase [Vibrio sp. RC27]